MACDDKDQPITISEALVPIGEKVRNSFKVSKPSADLFRIRPPSLLFSNIFQEETIVSPKTTDSTFKTMLQMQEPANNVCCAY